MTTKLPFTKATVRRAIESVRSEGLEIRAVAIGPDGTITIHSGQVPVAPETAPADTVERPKRVFQA